MTELKSVNCVLRDDGIVIPRRKNGELYYGGMCSLLDIDEVDNWFQRLDTKDRKIVDNWIKNNTNFWGDK